METITKNAIPYIGSGMTKIQIENLANHAIETVLEEGKVLVVAEALSAMEKFIEAVKKDPRYIDYVREELSKNAGKLTTSSGAKLEACEVGTKYNYEGCNDPFYKQLMFEKAMLDAEIKNRENLLKKLPDAGMQIMNGDELVMIYKPLKTSLSSYKVTLAK